jgi:hypothetical protein
MTDRLETQKLIPGDVANIDGEVNSVFIGEVKGGFVFVYDVTDRQGECIGEAILSKSTTSFDGDNVSTNGEKVSSTFYYDIPRNKKRYDDYLDLLKWAGLRK